MLRNVERHRGKIIAIRIAIHSGTKLYIIIVVV